jgi:hypothetical protein
MKFYVSHIKYNSRKSYDVTVKAENAKGEVINLDLCFSVRIPSLCNLIEHVEQYR